MPHSDVSALRADLAGGLVSSALAIPLAIGFGMFAFVALGDEYFAYGAFAGLLSALIAGVVMLLLGDRSVLVYAPRITTTFFLGLLLYSLVHSDFAALNMPAASAILLVFFAIVLLGGVLQALFGLLRLGTLIKFAPHPVMAGFQNMAAVLLFTLNGTAIALGIASLALVAVYPFAKRFTWWPQVFLGLAFNWGVLVAFAAHGGTLHPAPMLAYAAGILWTLFYDTIYAHQDAEDDALIGVKSTARLFGKDSPRWLLGFAAGAVLLLAAAVAATRRAVRRSRSPAWPPRGARRPQPTPVGWRRPSSGERDKWPPWTGG